jgi:hypothetical protein
MDGLPYKLVSILSGRSFPSFPSPSSRRYLILAGQWSCQLKLHLRGSIPARMVLAVRNLRPHSSTHAAAVVWWGT